MCTQQNFLRLWEIFMVVFLGGKCLKPPAEIIIVKHLIRRHKNVTRVWVEPRSYDQNHRKNDGFITISASLSTSLSSSSPHSLNCNKIFFNIIEQNINPNLKKLNHLSITYKSFTNAVTPICQRWSRGHKARG